MYTLFLERCAFLRENIVVGYNIGDTVMNIILLLFDMLVWHITFIRLVIIYFTGSKYNIDGLRFLDVMQHADNKYFNQSENEPTVNVCRDDVRAIIRYDSYIYGNISRVQQRKVDDKCTDDALYDGRKMRMSRRSSMGCDTNIDILQHDMSPSFARNVAIGASLSHGSRQTQIHAPESKLGQELEQSSTQEPEQSLTQEPEQSSTQEPEQSSTQEPEQSSIQEPEQSSTQELEQCSTQEPEQSLTQEPEQSSIQEPEQSLIQEPEQSSIQEPEQSLIQEPEQSSIQEPEQSLIQEPEQSSIQEPEQISDTVRNIEPPSDHYNYQRTTENTTESRILDIGTFIRLSNMSDDESSTISSDTDTSELSITQASNHANTDHMTTDDDIILKANIIYSDDDLAVKVNNAVTELGKQLLR